MPIYRSTGQLTGTIDFENVPTAQAYLLEDDMTQFLDEPLKRRIERIEWHLNNDGRSYYVEAIAPKKLSAKLLKELASWVSGQNSDGLGEGFEQQDFAWDEDEEQDEIDGYVEQNGQMISFDWRTNDSTFVQI